jgi:hypothetical protein
VLQPKYIEQLPDNLVQLYSQVERDIIADMVRRITTYDFFIPAAEYQFQKLQDMGLLNDEIVKKLSAVSGISTDQIKLLIKEAGAEALKADDSIYRKAGLNPTPLDSNAALQAVLAAGIDKTSGVFQNLTRTTANTAAKQFERALDRAYMQITSGAFDYNSAIRMAVKDLCGKGVATIEYPSGHVDYMEVAIRRATVTGVNQTAAKLQDTRANEMESDLVETTAHAGARPEHAVWQGKIFSRSGTHPKYPDFVTSTGYGTGAGLCGWNCRHNFFPYLEGISEPAYSKTELEKMSAKDYVYNGQAMTEYEAAQKQRYIERQIRKWKREYTGMEAAGMPTEESASKISAWQRTQKDFIKQTGLKRQTEREQIGDFSRSQAQKVVQAAKKSEKVAIVSEKAYNIKRQEVRKLILSPDTPKSLNIGNQNKHIKNSKGYIQGRSYIYGDKETAQRLINQYSGTGEIRINDKGEWVNKEFIEADFDIGVVVDFATGKELTTNRFSIHYGKKGTHIVPAKRRDKN